MKKLIALLLIGVLCLSLVACGTNQSSLALIATYEKKIAELEALLAERDAEINRLLSGGDNAGTGDAGDGNASAGDSDSENADPQYAAVALTVDNWDTYFEVVTFPEFTENAFGEVDGFNLRHFIRLKEEYYPLLNAEQTSIIMEIAYNYGERMCSVDLEKQTYALGERTRTVSTTSIADRFYDSGSSLTCSPFGVEFYDVGKVRYYEDVEMVRIQGTLSLAVE